MQYQYFLVNQRGFRAVQHFFRSTTMKFASAYYAADVDPEIYVFIDEEPSDLPEGAVEIGKETDLEKFLALVEPYFIMAKDGSK